MLATNPAGTTGISGISGTTGTTGVAGGSVRFFLRVTKCFSRECGGRNAFWLGKAFARCRRVFGTMKFHSSFSVAVSFWTTLVAFCVAIVLPVVPVANAAVRYTVGSDAERAALSALAAQLPAAHAALLNEMPATPFRSEILALEPEARTRLLSRLAARPVPQADYAALHAHSSGAMFYVCELGCPDGSASAAGSTSNTAGTAAGSPLAADAPSLPISSPPVFHSRPSAVKKLVLDFSGMTITGTIWNDADTSDTSSKPSGRPKQTTIIAKPFSLDNDFTTFSAEEQQAIAEIWARVAEDYSPFDVDVTTERPDAYTGQTARALITSKTAGNSGDGVVMPYCNVGGISYVGYFGTDELHSMGPSFIYYDKLENKIGDIADAAAHELGHTMGLYHDGVKPNDKNSGSYYTGHGTGATSWGTIMGNPYGKNLSQWSKGDYPNANNTEDDIAIIAGKLGYRLEIKATAVADAQPLTAVAGDTLGASGVLLRAGDAHFYSFTLDAPATVNLSLEPYRAASGSQGGNTDLTLEVLDVAGTRVTGGFNDPTDATSAALTLPLAAGAYRVRVGNITANVGTPLAASGTSGYTPYGCIGQYKLTSDIPLSADTPVLTPPAFTTNLPADSTAAGGAVTLSVAATGVPAPVLRWQEFKNGVWTTLNDAAGNPFNQTTLELSALKYSADNGRRIRAVAINGVADGTGAEEIYSAETTLAVPVALPALTWQTNHGSQAVTAGDAVSFSVELTGGDAADANLEFTYSWKRAGGSVIAGANSATLALDAVSADDDDTVFIVTVTAPDGQTASLSATLTVQTPPAFSSVNSEPTISLTQQTAGVDTGIWCVTLTAPAIIGDPVPALRWQEYGGISGTGSEIWNDLYDVEATSEIAGVAGATTGNLVLSDLTSGDNGRRFRCVATNVAGSVITGEVTLADIPDPPAPAAPAETSIMLPAVNIEFGKSTTVAFAPLVRFEFAAGSEAVSVDFRLFTGDAPKTVENFLKYVRAGGSSQPNYTGTVLHRAELGTLVQGGGYRGTGTGDYEHIGDYGTVTNELKRSNIRGTLALAKRDPQEDEEGNLIAGTGPNSGTSEWFINLADNAHYPYTDSETGITYDLGYDSLNGGYTVFGEVASDGGLDFFDAVCATPDVNGDGYISESSGESNIPFADDGSLFTITGTYELNAGATLVSNSAADILDASLENAGSAAPTLRLASRGTRTGTATLVIAFSGTDGRRALHTVTVKVYADPANPPAGSPTVSAPAAVIPQSSQAAARSHLEEFFDGVRGEDDAGEGALVSGCSVEFNVAASVAGAAAGSGVTYQWLKNGEPLEDSEEEGVTGVLSATLSVAAYDPADVYSVAVTNVATGITIERETAPVKVLAAPEITVKPAALTVLESVAGGEAALSVEASGLGQLYYQWYQQGWQTDDAGNYVYDENNALIAAWTPVKWAVLPVLKTKTAGIYRVVVSDRTGLTAEAEAAVVAKQSDVPAPPSIPAGKTVHLVSSFFAGGTDGGATVAIKINADGTATFQGYSVALNAAVTSLYSNAGNVFHGAEGVPMNFKYERNESDVDDERFCLDGTVTLSGTFTDSLTGRQFRLECFITLAWRDNANTSYQLYSLGAIATDIEAGIALAAYDYGEFVIE